MLFFRKVRKTHAFTLAELIIVIVILAILATIAFISYQEYISKARDSVRTTDVSNINTALSVSQAKTSFLPPPISSIALQSSGVVIWYQWSADQNILSIIGLSDAKDPVTKNPYSYSITADASKYQIFAALEDSSGFFSKGAPLGIVLETNRNAAIESILTAGTVLDIGSGATSSGYTAYFPNGDFVVSSDWLTPLISSVALQDSSKLSKYDASLIGYWDMETLTGATLMDWSRYGNNGTASGSVVIGKWMNWEKGRYTYFDGSWIINLSKASLSGSVNFTVCSTAAPIVINNAHQVYGESILPEGNSPTFGYQIRWASSGARKYYYVSLHNGVSFSTLEYVPTPIIQEGIPVNYCFRKSGSNAAIFVNGVKESESSTMGTIKYASYGYIGRLFIGNIDELRIFNRSLTDWEIHLLSDSAK